MDIVQENRRLRSYLKTGNNLSVVLSTVPPSYTVSAMLVPEMRYRVISAMTGGGGDRALKWTKDEQKTTTIAFYIVLFSLYGLIPTASNLNRRKRINHAHSVVGKVTVTPLQSYITSYFLE